MQKSLEFAFAAGSISILASAALGQGAAARLSPQFQVQPQNAQEYAPYSVRPSIIWRTPVFPPTWDAQPVAPFAWEEPSAPDRASRPAEQV
jgi:hypothetical protein